MNRSILITGANVGLGKETARQLALKEETEKVILFCRNQAKAEAAKKELEDATGRKIVSVQAIEQREATARFESRDIGRLRS
jgi:short-subunit dehydrogenase